MLIVIPDPVDLFRYFEYFWSTEFCREVFRWSFPELQGSGFEYVGPSR